MNSTLQQNQDIIPISLNNIYYTVGDSLVLSNIKKKTYVKFISPKKIILDDGENNDIFYSSVKDLKKNLYTSEKLESELFFLNPEKLSSEDLKEKLTIIDLISIEKANPLLSIEKSLNYRIQRLETFLINEKIKREILLMRTLTYEIVLKLIIKFLDDNLKGIYKTLIVNTSQSHGIRLLQNNCEKSEILDPIYNFFSLGYCEIKDNHFKFTTTSNDVFNYDVNIVYCEFKKILKSIL